jgi:glycerol-3-phosphate dehydrogenase (NAD(P)+)
MTENRYPVGVIGSGAWGSALAAVMAQKHEQVLLWSFEQDVADAINSSHMNSVYLPNFRLPENIIATTNIARMPACDFLLLVTPAQHLRVTLLQLPKLSAPVILCSKGIEADSAMLMSEVVGRLLPETPFAVLSGPTFAHEVAGGLPTAVTLACEDRQLGQELSRRIATPNFRPYFTDDVIGTEIGGAVKNVLAIGCGVVDGAGFGLNARAALIARGFAEMQRYGLARGARADTLAGLSGLGDLVLTCNSENSRNFSLGRGLGQGKSAASLLADRRTVAEGASTAPILLESAQTLGVEMPIVTAICTLLEGRASVPDIVAALLSRPLRPER